jgi:hypothetical protein
MPFLIATSIARRRAFAVLGVFCCLAGLCSSMAQGTAPMPKIQGESLAAHTVVLPDAVAGKIAILIFGFTKASKVPTSAWADKLQAGLGSRPDLELYQLPVLEDVPRLFRSMVISGIKKGVAENKRDHFVPILQGEAELKKLVRYKEPDDAYLIILGGDGNIVQQVHGAPTDENYRQAKSAIEPLLNQR